MTSLAAFSKRECPTHGPDTVHVLNRCLHCGSNAAPAQVVSVDPLTVAAHTFGQSLAVTTRRQRRAAQRARVYQSKPRTGRRLPYGERSSTALRDYAVIAHLAEGLTCRAEIARRLGTSPQAITPIIRRAYQRFGLPVPANGQNDHGQLVAMARARGVIR